jgi:hypothetical protein
MKQRWHFRQSSSSIVPHGVKKPHVSYLHDDQRDGGVDRRSHTCKVVQIIRGSDS